MADDISAELLSDGEYAAEAEFNKKLKQGAPVKDMVKDGLKAGATVAAAGACAATGVGAIAAPLCGWIGGEIVGPIVDAVEDVVNWIGDLFSDPPPITHLIEAKDLEGVDPALIKLNQRIYALTAQAERCDVILGRRYVDVLRRVADAVTAMGGDPDPDRIMAKIGQNLPLEYWGNFGWGRESVTACHMVASDLRDPNDPKGYEFCLYLGRTPPDFKGRATDIQVQLTQGALNPQQALAALQQNLDDAAAWSDQLTIEAARVLMLVGLGDIVRAGFTTTDPRRVAPHAREPDPKMVAAANAMYARMRQGIFPESYLKRHGIVAGVQFLRV